MKSLIIFLILLSNWAQSAPNCSSILVSRCGIETLTNKTISAGSNTLTGIASSASPTFTGTVTMPSGSITSSAWSTGGNPLTASYYQSSADANPAQSGDFRLGNGSTVAWRNAANNGQVGISVDGSNNFTWNGVPVFNSTPVLLAAAFPALSGDVTTVAGSLSSTVSSIGGVAVGTPSGTGNVLMSASPTTTGTMTAAAITASGKQQWTLARASTYGANYHVITGNVKTATSLITGAAGAGYPAITYNAAPSSTTATYTYDSNDTASILQFGSGSNAGFFFYLAPLNGGGQGAALTKTLGFSVDINGAITMPLLATSSAAQTGTVCSGALGNLTVDTTVACLASTIKVKKDVEPLDVGLKEVMKLRPISYNLKKKYDHGEGRMVGLIAEEVEKVDKRLIAVDDNGDARGVRYMQLTAVLVKAIQEQQVEIKKLQAQVRKLSVDTE